MTTPGPTQPAAPDRGHPREAASGLYPRELAGGLSSAVAALSDRCPIPVELSVTHERFDPETEIAA